MIWIMVLIVLIILILLALAFLCICLCRMADDLEDDLEQAEWCRKYLREKGGNGDGVVKDAVKDGADGDESSFV